tara:strand:+ start:1037 stop:1972 length:936 start_codon:yes stop_codon:yes gene_type:complete
MSIKRNTDWAGWEVDPSTRSSVHAYTKYDILIDASVANDAVTTVFTCDRGIPSVNLVANPRVEHATISEFTADGSAISRSTDQAATGAASLLVNPTNSAAAEGFYWATPGMAGNAHDGEAWLVAQCEVRGASASGDAEIVIQDSSGTDLIVGSSVSLSTAFQAIKVKYKLPITGTAAYRVKVRSKTQHNINWYTDKIHVEQRFGDSNYADYVDGAQGLNYEWEGTADLSPSKRRAGISVIRGFSLRNASGTAADIVYVGLDVDAAAGTGIPIYGGETFTTNWPIDFRSKITVRAAQNTPAIHGVVWGIHQG